MNEIKVISNNNDWCYYSWEKEIETNKKFAFFKTGLPVSSFKIINKLCGLHYSERINSKIKIPFKSIWYKNFIKTLNIKKDVDTLLIVYDWSRLSIDLHFFSYIRKKYPKCKLIYMFTNIVSITGSTMFRTINKLNKSFDCVFAFDKLDSIKYNFCYSPLIYDRLFDCSKYNEEYDLFYVGQAKDRLDELYYFYKIAKSQNLKCLFYIVGVPDEKQIQSNEIVYNQKIEYKKVLDFIKKSRCLLDVIQKNSTGLTIKVCEAVVYSKKLISTNYNITKENFYDSNRILIVDKNSSYDFKKFIGKEYIPYTDDDKKIFTASRLYKQINDFLHK